MEGFSFVTPVTGLKRPNTRKEYDDDDRSWEWGAAPPCPCTPSVPNAWAQNLMLLWNSFVIRIWKLSSCNSTNHTQTISCYIWIKWNWISSAGGRGHKNGLSHFWLQRLKSPNQTLLHVKQHNTIINATSNVFYCNFYQTISYLDVFFSFIIKLCIGGGGGGLNKKKRVNKQN
jgi:hypothetical protein